MHRDDILFIVIFTFSLLLNFVFIIKFLFI